MVSRSCLFSAQSLSSPAAVDSGQGLYCGEGRGKLNSYYSNGHPAWGSLFGDLNTHQTQVMDIRTNIFCASGMHLPNGSYVTFGGNGAVGSEAILVLCQIMRAQSLSMLPIRTVRVPSRFVC
ncbi:hypothetical protein GYMLUDRAFT_161620 [Collybiopsis luxurians FD-317 M1]|uniref:Uncharacterized protein n=1 Tax=Collybiopsis luxurians FD-317 M1 TaxID=944289 RepID=A0A0D0BIT0_9AGAR|nr:hypothetical protein GYMLUDRAFT_161620 [Collybiopsis luxurians FD-317 M1]